MSDTSESGAGELRRLQEIGELSNDQYKGDPNFMASLARGLEVLQAFQPQYSQMSVSEISQITGIPRAAVRRCLYTLRALGFVHCPDGRHYRLLPRVLTIGHAYLSSSELAKAAQNSLDYLSKLLNESCSVATLDGDNILYIARASVKRIMTIDLGRGSRLPAYATSMGLVLLSALDEDQLDDYLSRVSFEPLTEFTVTNAEQLRDVARYVPLDRILVETDSPYLAPVPHRGKENQPAYVRDVAEYMAVLKGVSLETLAEATTANFSRLFHIEL